SRREPCPRPAASRAGDSPHHIRTAPDGLGSGLDVPGDQLGAEGFRQLFGEHGLARTWLTLDQQGALQGDGGIDRELEVVGGDVGLGAFDMHRKNPQTVAGRAGWQSKERTITRGCSPENAYHPFSHLMMVPCITVTCVSVAKGGRMEIGDAM